MIVAVLDACVLYQAALRDLFMHLTVHFVLQPKWTDQIHEEWIRNVLEHRPDLERAQLVRTRDLMNRWARDWQTPDYEELIPSLSLPDPDDRHVLAAAIAASAARIVTFNLSDFPKTALAPYGVSPQHPDEFSCDLFDETPQQFLHSVQTHRASLKNPRKSVEEYLATLNNCGLRKITDRLATHQDVI